MTDDPRRALPAVHEMLKALGADSDPITVSVVRDELQRARRSLADGGSGALDEKTLLDRVRRRLSREGPGLVPVLNLTGVVLHTNLGRAPLAPQAVEAVRQAAQGYADLELSLETGERSSRLDHVEELLRIATGAEAALVVNNNAAGVFLALTALARDREVVISRGELVEIGGSFRIPDIMAASGALLVEVGTTNRTRLDDYRRALGDRTAAVMKVHPSNFRQRGFVESVPIEDLAGLARERGVVLLDDVGSGSLLPVPGDEPTVAERLKAGSDVVLFSGDKLLGGPQAGIVAGRADVVTALKRHPLFRALRPDKMTLAALRATLHVTLRNPDALPARAMILADRTALRRRAARLRRRLLALGLTATLTERAGASGGGSLPEHPLPGVAVAVDPGAVGADDLRRRLRTGSPSLLALAEDGMILLDVRTLPDDRLGDVVSAFRTAVQGG